jgi:hypothetical protein
MFKNNDSTQGKTSGGQITLLMNLLPLTAVAILVVSTMRLVKASPAEQTSSTTFSASSDAQVAEATPGKNYGKTTYLQVDGNSGARIESYILFAVSGLEGSVSNATLRIYDRGNGSSDGPALYGTDTSWIETDVTWNNRPAAITSSLGNQGGVGENVWVEYDVTFYVTADGTYSFALVADSNDGLTFSSREDAQPPQLVVTTSTGSPTQPADSAVLAGAGDISVCTNDNDEATAKLLDEISGTVFTTGDNVYTSGTTAEYKDCYDPTWGRHKSRTQPVPGNHEYRTSNAAGYFQYFSNVESYYAYNLGDWRIYALNSEIDVSATSAQVKWLKGDLAANPRQCVLAYWHQPRWSSGDHHGSDSKYQALWKTLYDAGAELVINGHEHHYERFTQMNAYGQPVRKGMREIVVGTGGAGLYGFGTALSTSQVRNSSTHGVLKLILTATEYQWEFIPVTGKTFTDKGSTSCR